MNVEDLIREIGEFEDRHKLELREIQRLEVILKQKEAELIECFFTLFY
jgi:hypothetical protein